MTFTTGQLAQYIAGTLQGDSTATCSGAEIDTRRDVKGKVFFALQGEHSDGHEFVQEAASNGCSAVVVSRVIDVDVPQVIVEEPRKALYALATARRVHINAPIIAITGSVGKTTTKDLVASMLPTNTVASRYSFNNDLGVPLTLLEAEDAEFIVVEVGANAVGEIEYLSKLVKPDVAILTSISSAHLEGFGSIETVLKEKAKLLDAVHQDGIIVVHDSVDISDCNFSARVIRVGASEYADVQISVDVSEQGFSELDFCNQHTMLSTLGSNNAENAALGAVAVSSLLTSLEIKHSMSELLEKASQMQGPTGRLQMIEKQGVLFIDDSYNANPASMRSALSLIKGLDAHRKVLILGEMLELGEDAHAEHRLLANDIKKVDADLIILVGEHMHAASEAIPHSFYESTPNEEAIRRIKMLLCPQDTVLIKGSRELRLERIIGSSSGIKV